jgi:hypothetical protein
MILRERDHTAVLRDGSTVYAYTEWVLWPIQQITLEVEYQATTESKLCKFEKSWRAVAT